MYFKSVAKLVIISAVLMSTYAKAGLILETYDSGVPTSTTLGGFSMTDFAVTNSVGGSTSSVSSPISGVVSFEDINGSPLDMYRDLADSTSWWNNAESSDVDIFTTGVHWVKILLPKNTRAFSFNVGASSYGSAWLEAYEGNTLSVSRHYFGVSDTNTPGFGIYADNSGDGCSAISSVIVEPFQWGVGNFSINQDDSCTNEVPEPGSLGLLGLGLLGLGIIRRRTNAA